ncbi:Dephospho-CoA kinase [Candidatus Clavichlamydia salmonicola]|uniref:dephospho-CoA kinase n=1 Tax=Candidatus Clavichlamydia salmonicola TaxID=469812 RepID=UPI00189127B9|nr:dephospho-CoA kinase [Candidatus Clavichlamydia salmonicola]MBF5050985.1 Dephospho-CoA kinase [Candidatus Clavichlamydia salmonicola]
MSITGGLASGKTSVNLIFRELGAFVVFSDEIVHYLLSPHTDLGKTIIELLGPEIVKDDKLDRKVIANKVFSDYCLLDELEKIIHPKVHEAIEEMYLKAVSSNKKILFVVEIPFLYTSGHADWYDTGIYVSTTETERKKRFVLNRQQDLSEFERRAQRFMPDKDACNLANIVIDNNGSMANLRSHVLNIFNFLKETP